jgi:hypothetical protein
MGIPLSLLVLAAGAILAFAVTGSTSGIDVQTVGWILMAAGFVGLLLSLIMWETWAGGAFWTRRAYDGPPPARRRYPAATTGRSRRVVHEEEEGRY